MKTLYWDCGMGAAGDMLAAALLELLPEPDAFLDEMNHLGIPGVHVKKSASVKCGIHGTHFTVTVDGVEEEVHDLSEHHHGHGHDHADEHSHDHPHGHKDGNAHHHHSGMHDIEHIIEGLTLPEKVRGDILAVYRLIAEAEKPGACRARHGNPFP
jgi:uncharacterized protein (DUF111 family)